MSAIQQHEITPSSTFTYAARCVNCDERFDAMGARWCDCVTPLRTLQCPSCRNCFCRAPFPYKRKFWSDAPRQLSQDPRRFYVQFGATVSKAAVPIGRGYAKRRPVILVVDDDESMRSYVASYVEQLGYRSVTASNPEVAFNLIDKLRLDVIITDALMPKMDGREMCRLIKSSEAGRSQKVIVMTSLYKSRAAQTEAIHKFGADAIVTKPLDLGALTLLLARLAPIEREALA